LTAGSSGTYHLQIFEFLPHEFINLDSDLSLDLTALLFLDQLSIMLLAEVLCLITGLPNTWNGENLI
jgi:hypothetical protein